jgi:hypothetical protein
MVLENSGKYLTFENYEKLKSNKLKKCLKSQKICAMFEL